MLCFQGGNHFGNFSFEEMITILGHQLALRTGSSDKISTLIMVNIIAIIAASD